MEYKKMLDVFAIQGDLPLNPQTWVKIGVAYVRPDDSLEMVLDLFPRVGKIYIPQITPNDSPTSLGV